MSCDDANRFGRKTMNENRYLLFGINNIFETSRLKKYQAAEIFSRNEASKRVKINDMSNDGNWLPGRWRGGGGTASLLHISYHFQTEKHHYTNLSRRLNKINRTDDEIAYTNVTKYLKFPIPNPSKSGLIGRNSKTQEKGTPHYGKLLSNYISIFHLANPTPKNKYLRNEQGRESVTGRRRRERARVGLASWFGKKKDTFIQNRYLLSSPDIRGGFTLIFRWDKFDHNRYPLRRRQKKATYTVWRRIKTGTGTTHSTRSWTPVVNY